MTVAWTQHRFSGGVLALDTTNTVVHRGDPQRRFDRFDDPAEIARFAAAASVFRRDEIGRPLTVADAGRVATTVRALRESIDALFRRPASGEPLEAAAMARFLRDCATAIEAGEELLRDRRGAVRASARAAGLRGGAGGFGAVAARRGQSQTAEDLPELQLAVSRQEPQFQPFVVRYGGLRKPRQGKAALQQAKDAKGEDRCLEGCRLR